MRLIDAERLISNLSDYALQEAPMWDGESSETYDAIKRCISEVEAQPTLKPAIMQVDGKLKVRLKRVYEKHSTEK